MDVNHVASVIAEPIREAKALQTAPSKLLVKLIWIYCVYPHTALPCGYSTKRTNNMEEWYTEESCVLRGWYKVERRSLTTAVMSRMFHPGVCSTCQNRTFHPSRC